MSRFKDFSEFTEIKNLFSSITGSEEVVAKEDNVLLTESEPVVINKPEIKQQSMTEVVKSEQIAAPEAVGSKADQLENTLMLMCKRGGLIGAVISDSQGLLIAVHNSPVENERLAAFTTILGDALISSERLLGGEVSNYISIDINYTDKAVLRSFAVEKEVNYLMVICSQEVDERSEVEISIDKVTTILSKAGEGREI